MLTIKEDEELTNICEKKVRELFEDNPDFEVRNRLERELTAIKENGYTGTYMMWRSIVKKSLDEGYPIGIRGCVGSSFVAYLAGITNINPLSNENGGYQIPAEVFMGLGFDKKPDFAINVSSNIYNSIDDNLHRLDIHEHPSCDMLHNLQEATGVRIEDIPLDDEDVLKLLCDTELEIIQGIPEFGHEYARDMIKKAKPKTFDDLVKISALCHGTNVWDGNQEELFGCGEIELPNCIASRDDIMLFLMNKDMSKEDAYEIMELVRKGKGLSDEKKALMKECGVPDWYIKVCERIRYLFPKAHCISYTMMVVQLAHYMLTYPIEYNEALSEIS